MPDDSLLIQWYPGHMAKTRRRMEEDLKLVDLLCEVIDARIPVSSRNPDLSAIIGAKPRLIIFNRSGQADPEQNRRWMSRFQEQGVPALETDCKTGAGISAFPSAARAVLKEKLRRYAEKRQSGRPIRAMVAGVPNVGKSAFINRVAKRKTAKVEDRPGVTRGRQWVNVDAGLELMDTRVSSGQIRGRKQDFIGLYRRNPRRCYGPRRTPLQADGVFRRALSDALAPV
jgi:ribosome biogenesis GTPase A